MGGSKAKRLPLRRHPPPAQRSGGRSWPAAGTGDEEEVRARWGWVADGTDAMQCNGPAPALDWKWKQALDRLG